MGDKDKTHKILEAYNDVFADICNVLLFHGEQIIKNIGKGQRRCMGRWTFPQN